MQVNTIAVVYSTTRKIIDDEIKLTCEDIQTFDKGTTVERCHAAMKLRDELNEKHKTPDRWYSCETRQVQGGY